MARNNAGLNSAATSLAGVIVVVAAVGLAVWWSPWTGVDLPPVRRLVPYLGYSDQPEGDQAVAGTATSLESAVEHQEQARAPYCRVGEQPHFTLAFSELKQRVGSTMGLPIECEHSNPENGDTLQRTTTGLAVYHQPDDSLRFTDGWRHWALVGGNEIQWEGSASDPPPAAARTLQARAA